MSLSPLEATWDISDTALRDEVEVSSPGARPRHADEDGRMSFADYLSGSFARTHDNLARMLDRG